MGRQPRLDVDEVRGRLFQPVGEAEAVGELVGTPVDGELRVQGVGEQRRVAEPFGVGLCLVGEPGCALGLPGVRPGPGQRRGEARARRSPRRARASKSTAGTPPGTAPNVGVAASASAAAAMASGSPAAFASPHARTRSATPGS